MKESWHCLCAGIGTCLICETLLLRFRGTVKFCYTAFFISSLPRFCLSWRFAVCIHPCCYSQLAHDYVSLHTDCQSEHSAVFLGVSVGFLWHGQHVPRLPWRGLLGLAVCLWGISHLGRTRDFDLLLAWRPVAASLGSRSFFRAVSPYWGQCRRNWRKDWRTMCVSCVFSTASSPSEMKKQLLYLLSLSR